MTKRENGLRRGRMGASRLLPCSTAIALAIGLAPQLALAQGTPGGAGGQPLLAQSQARTFDIPAQPLTSALTAFGDQAGMQVTVDTAILAGRTSQPVSGSMAPEEALRRLLAGSGITWRFSDSRTLVLSRAETAPGAVTLDPVRVEGVYHAPPQAQIGNVLPEYPGGQVARGGKVGVLGNRSLMDTPFNQTSYTSKLMEDQQSHFVSDVLNNDPSARANSSPSTGLDGFSIRGFDVSNQDILFNGMLGVAPSYFNSVMAESFERVEVIKGPNALLNGLVQGGSVGGAINLVPKRAGDQPLIRFTPDYSMDSRFGGHVDIGQRLGKENDFGVRFNGVYRDGDTPIDHQSRESRLAAVGLDYRGERVRLDADLANQKQDVQGTRRFTSVAPGVQVPSAPDSRSNWFDPVEFTNSDVNYGTLRGEFDLTDAVTVFAGVGGSDREQTDLSSNRLINNANGDLAAGSFFFGGGAYRMYSLTAESGVRGRFDTGPVQHQLTLAYSTFYAERADAQSGPAIAYPASNLYAPVFATPNLSTLPGTDSVRRRSERTLSSTTLADALSILDERAQLIVGARYQEVDASNFNANTGLLTSSYADNAVTPMVGIVVKPWRDVSLYANYIEGLQEGATAPLSSVNAGEVFAPFVTKQYEAGSKIDFGRFGATLAVYQVARPSGITDPITNIFGIDGEQRHRGIDVNIFGEVTDGIRLLGGVAFIQSELTKTQGGLNEGNNGIGVPEWRAVLGVEWDTPFIEGLTLAGRVLRNGEAYLDAANTQVVPAWTRVDIGARYRFERAAGKPIVVRAGVENALGADYWDASGSSLILSDPLTFKLSASFDF